MVTQCVKDEAHVFCDSTDSFCQRMSQLYQLRKNRTFCDVVLQVGSTEIHAHRSVLACASPYFFELFTADDETRTASEEKLIYKLNVGFDHESVEMLVTYSYTGKLEAPSHLVKSVFTAANKLKMYKVALSCGEHLVTTLTPETCLSVRALPGIAASSDLVSRVENYIQEQPSLLEVTREPSDIPKVLLKVILASWDDCGITSRALVSLCLEWIQKQIKDEDLTIEALQDKVHLLYLNFDNSLHDCSDIQTGAANDSEIVQDYKKISRKHSQTGMKIRRKSSINRQPAKPRMMLFSRSINDSDEDCHDGEWKIIAFSKACENSYLGIVTLDGLVTVLSIQPHLQQKSTSVTSSRPPSVEKTSLYTLIPHMSTPKCASGTGTFQGKLLVCGGYDRGECLKGTELYDAKANEWKSLPDMRQIRGRFDLTTLDGKAYAVGGCNGTKELACVDVLDETYTWSSVAPLPLARSNTGVTSLLGKIFCIGGWNGMYGIKRCDMYCPVEDTWSTIAPLHTGRYQAGVASLNGLVYAAGGCDSWNCLSSVEVYNPTTNVWRHVANMNTPRRGCGMATFEGKLYVMGGSDGIQSLCSVEIYEPESNTWSLGPSMTSCRANVGATLVEDRIYAVGGFSGKAFLNSIEFLDSSTQEWTTFTPRPESQMGDMEMGREESASASASEDEQYIYNNTIGESIEEEDGQSSGEIERSKPMGINIGKSTDEFESSIDCY